jgi:hypothetical protein
MKKVGKSKNRQYLIRNTHHSKRWSLPPILANLLPCRGLHAIRSLQDAPRYPLYALSSILYHVSCILSSFLTNKPNVKIGKISLSIVMIKYYDSEQRKMNSQRHKNKPNSNPNKANSKPMKAGCDAKQSRFEPNSNPILTHLFRLLGNLRGQRQLPNFTEHHLGRLEFSPNYEYHLYENDNY